MADLALDRRQAERSGPPSGGVAIAGPRQAQLKAYSAMLNPAPAAPAQRVAAPPPNRTGLPDGLKAGIESLSGLSLDAVKVHRNSSKPAQLNAHAFAQGTDIHVAPGQERHLPHEAWHVVQQAQGRVKPTMQLKAGIPINDDAGLEHEADVMGARAARGVTQHGVERHVPAFNVSRAPVQRVIALSDADGGIYTNDHPEDTAEYYYTDKKIDEHPVFIPRTQIDALDAAIDEALEKKRSGDINYRYATEEGILRAFVEERSKACTFFTDEGGLKQYYPNNESKYNAARNALRHPLIKNPGGARGLAHRYTQPGGVLFSRLSKTAAQEKLHYEIPDSVQFFQVQGLDWQAELEKYRAFWTETSDLFAYGRHLELRGETPRNIRSKLRQGSKTTTGDHDHESFKGDSLTAKLPPAGSDTVDTGWIPYINYARSKDRGTGQYKAMGDWNALGYAAYMMHHGYPELKVAQDWEWLHIRGAQNGGATNAANLVAGTSTTNSRMIPWEDKINLWSNHATKEYPLEVRFQGWRVPGTHLGARIEIRIATPNGLPGFAGKVPKTKPMTLVFDPLNGTAFDRVSERLTSKIIAEEALKAEGGVQLSRNYVVNSGSYKGYHFEVREWFADRVTGYVSAAGVKKTFPRSMISLSTTEWTAPLPSKEKLREAK